MVSGISIREREVKKWLQKIDFRGEYLLVSTKQHLVYFRRLQNLQLKTQLIVDLYTPIFLEKELTLSKWKPQDWLTRWKNKEMVKKFLKRGTHFLVANRRQKQYWLETSRQMVVRIGTNDISVFPTGAENRPPATSYQLPATARKVMLWFGGIYPWMDPMPLIHAFAGWKDVHPDWQFRILGGYHPCTGYQSLYQNVIRKATSLIGKRQLDIVDWQPQSCLPHYFQDVAFAVHLPQSTKEDYYAHRVRLLTLARANIGVLTSGNDVISDLIVRTKAGLRIPSHGDVERIMIKTIHEPRVRERWSANTRAVEKAYIEQETDIQMNITQR